jgi:NADPH-dependent 2,4-dienoyl-CoA reductase/sulfur reductase-like enzyme
MKHIVIIGNGIAGITAARHIRKRTDYRITVISAESEHFYSRTALMYLYMGHMEYQHLKPYEDYFWSKNRIELLHARVTKVDTAQKQLGFQDQPPLSYDTLIIASGSKARKGGWKGEKAPNVHGLYNLQELEQMEANTKGIKHAVVVGGGLIGVEMAEMLHSRKIGVSLLAREEEYWSNVLPPEEGRIISQHLRDHQIDLRTRTELDEILLDDKGKARAVRTKGGDTIACQFVGITIGVEPNIAFLKDSKIETNKGILVDRYFRTSVPEVYAVGDCVEYREPLPGRKPIEQLWYTGRIHGLTVAATISGQPLTYKPGPWFNSAKFFDIEYQVYGEVPSKLHDGQEQLYWQHPQKPLSIRIVWEKESRAVQGFSLLGIRYRQAVCEKWINDKAAIEEVLPVLEQANFDPEFHRKYEDEIIALYEQQSGQKLQKAKKKRFWGIFK